MAVNKVVYGNDTLIDITDSTLSPQDVMKGEVFYNAGGVRKVGQKLNDLLNDYCGSDVDENGHWIRPEEYPNLDLIEFPEGFNGGYYTYDLRINPEINWLSLYIYPSSSSASITVQRGHLSEQGEFIADATYTGLGRGYYRRQLNLEDGEVQLWKVSSNGQITQLTFGWYTGYNDKVAMNSNQPCVERKIKLDYMTAHGGGPMSTSSRCWSTMYLKKDYWEDEGLNNGIRGSLAYLYGCSYALVDLDVSNVNTSNWIVTSMQYSFIYCQNLIKLDLSNWNTSNWTMANNSTLYQTWYCCWCLKQLNISNWNTSNWNIKSLYCCWTRCQSLKELDLSKWDTSNWTVDNLYQAFGSCYNLEKLDISNWDTSNWPVTTISYLFASCRRLKKLDLSKWDTSNWLVTSMVQVFLGCWGLEELKIPWDVSKWNPTSLVGLFSACYSLKELDISNWDISNWTNCTNIDSIFSSCYNAKAIKIPSGFGSYFPISTGNVCRACFGYCFNLQQLDLSHIDCSNWDITTLGEAFYADFNLKKLKLPSNLDLSKITSSSGWFTYVYQLRQIEGPTVTNLTYPYNLTDMRQLTVQSIINVFNMLGTLTTTKTFKISTSNLNKLTDAQIAIATAKGWTITA